MNENDEQEVTRRSGIAYAAGIGIFFAVLAFFGLGYLLDRWLGTSPWLMAVGILLGSAVGLYEFIRKMSKIN